MKHILKYYKNLSETQKSQFEAIIELYPQWNSKINVISRKDIDNLEVNHILHSLSVSQFITFKDGSNLLDLGTGGGFPGIPLAILFPNCQFHLIDRIGKKINVAREISSAIGLKNVTFQHGDIGECHQKFDFILTRGVMPLPDLIKISKKNVSSKHHNAYPNGYICLKGGDLKSELSKVNLPYLEENISTWMTEDFFTSKKIIYVDAQR